MRWTSRASSIPSAQAVKDVRVILSVVEGCPGSWRREVDRIHQNLTIAADLPIHFDFPATNCRSQGVPRPARFYRSSGIYPRPFEPVRVLVLADFDIHLR
jgi:hypothetical protein